MNFVKHVIVVKIMKKQPDKFSIDQPILSGNIYLKGSGKIKKVVSKGSLEKMKLEGEWKVVKMFENEINGK